MHPSHLALLRTSQTSNVASDLVMSVCSIEPHSPCDPVPHSANETFEFATPFSHLHGSTSHKVAREAITTMPKFLMRTNEQRGRVIHVHACAD